MTTRGSIDWLNGVLATPGFDPYSEDGQNVLNNLPRDSDAFKQIMLMQQRQNALTPGSAAGWWNQTTAGPNDAQNQAIANARWGDLDRQSRQFEDSQKNSERGMQLAFLTSVLGGSLGGYLNGSGYALGAGEGALAPAEFAANAGVGQSTGGNMGFFNSILGPDSPSGVDLSGFNNESVNPNGFNPGSSTGQFGSTTLWNAGPDLAGGEGLPWMNEASFGDSLKSLFNGQSGYGIPLAALQNALTGNRGGSILDQITGNPLGSAFNALPFGLALLQANSQKNDIAPYIQNLNNLAQQFSGNQAGYLKSLTDPYDQSTGINRQNLLQSLDQRGVSGSSFGDQALNNFDYTAGLGRADLLSKGIASGAATGANVNTQAINAINARNLSSNALLGAGLNASGQLFNPVANDPFGLKNLFGAAA